MIRGLDHFVLTVADIGETCAFYEKLGMKTVTFGDGRKALSFGRQKINLHQYGREFEPKAGKPTPGSADFCLLAGRPVDGIKAELAEQGIAVFEGPVKRTGAMTELQSIYIRDPDQNLVEIANEMEIKHD